MGSVVAGQKRCDCSAGAVFQEPEVLRFRVVFEDLQIVQSVVFYCLLLQDSQAFDDGLLLVHADCRWRCHEWLVDRRLKHVAGIGVVERQLLVFQRERIHGASVALCGLRRKKKRLWVLRELRRRRSRKSSIAVSYFVDADSSFGFGGLPLSEAVP